MNLALDRCSRSPSDAFNCLQFTFVLSPVVVGSVLTLPCLVSEYESIEQRLAYGSAVPSPLPPLTRLNCLPLFSPRCLSIRFLLPSFRTLCLSLPRMAFLTPFSTASLTSSFSTRKAIGHFIIPTHSRVRNLHSFVTPVFAVRSPPMLCQNWGVLSLDLWIDFQKRRN